MDANPSPPVSAWGVPLNPPAHQPANAQATAEATPNISPLLERRILAKYRAARYREVHALLISLDSDSTKEVRELQDLEKVLQDKYAIITRRITIPMRGGGDFLDKEFDDFERLYNAPDILLLVFFDGRGAQFQGLNLISYLYQLGTSLSDVVALFNQNSTLSDDDALRGKLPSRGGSSRTEMIRTTSVPPTPEHRSFTYHATRALRKLSAAPSFTAKSIAQATMNSIYTHDQNISESARNAGRPDGPNERHLQHVFNHTVKPTDRPQEVQEDIIIIPFKLGDLNDGNGVVSSEDRDLHRWGPLGPLPPTWEKRIDNKDSHWRPYYYDLPTSTAYWTRPWHSVLSQGSHERWRPSLFAAHATKALEQKMLDSHNLMVDVVLQTVGDLKQVVEAVIVESIQDKEGKDGTKVKDDVEPEATLPIQVRPKIEPQDAEDTFMKWADELLKKDEMILKEVGRSGSEGLPQQFQATERDSIVTKIMEHIREHEDEVEESPTTWGFPEREVLGDWISEVGV